MSKTKSNYLLNRFYKTAIVWLDGKGITVAIKKTKRAKLYNIYIQYELVAHRRNRQAAKRYIWNYFKEQAGL